MANKYKDEHGHWTTKENDGGPCHHEGGKLSKGQKVKYKGKQYSIGGFYNNDKLGDEDEGYDKLGFNRGFRGIQLLNEDGSEFANINAMQLDDYDDSDDFDNDYESDFNDNYDTSTEEGVQNVLSVINYISANEGDGNITHLTSEQIDKVAGITGILPEHVVDFIDEAVKDYKDRGYGYESDFNDYETRADLGESSNPKEEDYTGPVSESGAPLIDENDEELINWSIKNGLASNRDEAVDLIRKSNEEKPMTYQDELDEAEAHSEDSLENYLEWEGILGYDADEIREIAREQGPDALDEFLEDEGIYGYGRKIYELAMKDRENVGEPQEPQNYKFQSHFPETQSDGMHGTYESGAKSESVDIKANSIEDAFRQLAEKYKNGVEVSVITLPDGQKIDLREVNSDSYSPDVALNKAKRKLGK